MFVNLYDAAPVDGVRTFFPSSGDHPDRADWVDPPVRAEVLPGGLLPDEL